MNAKTLSIIAIVSVLGCNTYVPEGDVACTVVDNDDGTYTLACPDGTSVTIKDGDGCEVTIGEGTVTANCDKDVVTDGTLYGNVMLENSDDIRRYAGYEKITGYLVVSVVPEVILPNLVGIDGNLDISDPKVIKVSLPALTTVGGSMWMRDGNLTEVDLHSLTTIGGDLTITGLPECMAQELVSHVTVGGTTSITGSTPCE
jgi:hypothetical protein